MCTIFEDIRQAAFEDELEKLSSFLSDVYKNTRQASQLKSAKFAKSIAEKGSKKLKVDVKGLESIRKNRAALENLNIKFGLGLKGK